MKTRHWIFQLHACSLLALALVLTSNCFAAATSTDSVFSNFFATPPIPPKPDKVSFSAFLNGNTNLLKPVAGIFMPQQPPSAVNYLTTYPACNYGFNPSCPDINNQPPWNSGYCPLICNSTRTVTKDAAGAISGVQYPVCPRDYIAISTFNPDYEIIYDPAAPPGSYDAAAPVADFETLAKLKSQGYTCTLDPKYQQSENVCASSNMNGATNGYLEADSQYVTQSTINSADYLFTTLSGGSAVGQTVTISASQPYPPSSGCQGSSWPSGASAPALSCLNSGNNAMPSFSYPGAWYFLGNCTVNSGTKDYQVNFTFTYKFYSCTQKPGWLYTGNMVMTSLLCAHPTPAWFNGSQMLNYDGSNDTDGNPYSIP